MYDSQNLEVTGYVKFFKIVLGDASLVTISYFTLVLKTNFIDGPNSINMHTTHRMVVPEPSDLLGERRCLALTLGNNGRTSGGEIGDQLVS